jgi:hypothetical protein
MAGDDAGSPGALTAEALDQGIRKLAEQGADRAIADLTAVANRAVIELHKLARQEAGRRKGQPDWGSWARLANAARSGVLQVAAIRDSVKGLPLAQPAEIGSEKEEAGQ